MWSVKLVHLLMHDIFSPATIAEAAVRKFACYLKLLIQVAIILFQLGSYVFYDTFRVDQAIFF